MTQSTEKPIYHSLYKHVRPISPEKAQQNIFQFYSSNQQPPLPSVLQRSRIRKSHDQSLRKDDESLRKDQQSLRKNQKSLRKGISRVSQSKPAIQNDKQKEKGTLLNFNIQQVVQSKYHISKPRDQILQKSEYKISSRLNFPASNLQQGSNQNSLIDEYRIVTYRPAQQMNLNQNKQNKLNESNIKKINHHKNDSQSIEVINPSANNMFQLNTGRTSQNFDPFYSKNYRTDFNNTGSKFNRTQNQKFHKQEQQAFNSNNQQRGYFSLENTMGLSLNPIGGFQSSQVPHNSLIKDNQNDQAQLNKKIKHLEHQIVQIQRQKVTYIHQNKILTQQNQRINQLNHKLQQENSLLKKSHYKPSNVYSPFNQINKSTLSPFKTSKYDYHSDDKVIQNNRNNDLANFSSQIQILQKQFRNQIQTLQLSNAKLSKQISEKILQITDLTKKNKQKQQKYGSIIKQTQKYQQKVASQQQKLYRKDQKINTLSLQIDRLTIQLKDYKSKQPTQAKSLLSRQQTERLDLHNDLQVSKQKYQNLLRDYSHLQKKHNFMKDQLDHLKYLQYNSNTSSLTNRSSSKYNNIQNDGIKQITNLQKIQELQHELSNTQKNLKQIKEDYSNLKHNFRALQELYNKQQDQLSSVLEELAKSNQQKNHLEIQINNLEHYIDASKANSKTANQSLKLLQKEQLVLRLQREISTLEYKYQNLLTQINQIRLDRDLFNTKYLNQIDKSAQLTRIHNQYIQTYVKTLQKQEIQKVQTILLKYENLISSKNMEIDTQKQKINQIKVKHIEQVSKLTEQYQRSMQKLRLQQMQAQSSKSRYNQNNYKRTDFLLSNQKQNSLRVSRQKSRHNRHLDSSLNTNSHALNRIQMTVNYDSMSRRQLQSFTTNLQRQYNTLQNQHKSLTIQSRRLEDDFEENKRLLSHLDRQISFIKQNKQSLITQKLELCHQLEKVNTLLLDIKRINTPLQQENQLLKTQIKETQKNNISYTWEIQQLNIDLKNLKQKIIDRENIIDQCQTQIRQSRIKLLQEKQRCQKYMRQINILTQQKEACKSKEQYYKMLFQKTQRQLQDQLELKQTAFLKSQQLKKQVQKKNSPLKRSRNQNIEYEAKHRERDIYRQQIYRDFNKLLNLTSQTYTLQQILQNNEQQYLNKLFNIVRDEVRKNEDLKRLIVDMEQAFRKQKIHIKEDYDILYEKYLKYKAMSQFMEKDIEKYKSIIKKKDGQFAAIII